MVRRTAGAKAAAADKAAKAQKVMVAKRTLPHGSASGFIAMVKLARTADMSVPKSPHGFERGQV